MGFTEKEHKLLYESAVALRKKLELKYWSSKGSLMGTCIEASDKLAAVLRKAGLNARAKQVWILYQNYESCSDYCFEEHWIVEVNKGKEKMYIDVTLDQFQWAFDIQLPSIWMNKRLATFMLPRKPGRVTLDKCGWTSWYNTGNYDNQFKYKL